jgi:hypothetical protein
MTLEEHLASLLPIQQWQIALQLAEAALPIWEAFAATDDLHYYDGVVGMSHTIAPDLLARALAEARACIDAPGFEEQPHAAGRMKSLRHEFLEPIVALQDMDWELPQTVQLAFYAVSNLVDGLTGTETTVHGEGIRYVVANQAIDALQREGRVQRPEIHAILYQFGERA